MGPITDANNIYGYKCLNPTISKEPWHSQKKRVFWLRWSPRMSVIRVAWRLTCLAQTDSELGKVGCIASSYFHVPLRLSRDLHDPLVAAISPRGRDPRAALSLKELHALHRLNRKGKIKSKLSNFSNYSICKYQE